MLDLVDIFGPSSGDPRRPSDPWNSAPPTDDITSDPWDSVGRWLITDTHVLRVCLKSFTLDFCLFRLPPVTAVHSSTPVIGSPWTAPPSSTNASNPWAPRTDPWEAAPVSSSPVNHAWNSPTDGGTVQKHQPHQYAYIHSILKICQKNTLRSAH